MVSDGETRLVGLFAYPIRHSRSPEMQNLAFQKCGINMQYLAFEVSESNLAQAVMSIRTLNMVGANISMPNKIRVIDYLDELSVEAEMIGAVNTVVNRDGRLFGYNTDGLGYVRALESRGIVIPDTTVTIVGAGGAATAMIASLALCGARKIHIFNVRDSFYPNAERIRAMIERDTSCEVTLNDLEDVAALREAIRDSGVLANATSMGMTPEEDSTWLTDPSLLHESLLVTDTVYAPAKTLFLKMAEERGCATQNGYAMMLHQGAESFRLWTGKDMPVREIAEQMHLY